jgi:hypothetical protein
MPVLVAMNLFVIRTLHVRTFAFCGLCVSNPFGSGLFLTVLSVFSLFCLDISQWKTIESKRARKEKKVIILPLCLEVLNWTNVFVFCQLGVD